MTLGERIKKVRKLLNLTQQEFASRFGSTQNVLANYETDRRNPSASAFNNICKTFNISETWLRTGEGQMFCPTPETAIDEIVRDYGLDDLDRQIITEYLKLSESDRQAVKGYIQRVAQHIHQAPVFAPAPKPDYEAEARAEAEEYYREILEEKKRTASGSASYGYSENNENNEKMA